MMRGSYTSVGVAYGRGLDATDLARHVVALLGPVLLPARPGRWPVRISGGGQRDAWAEADVRVDQDPAANWGLVARFLAARYGELETAVDLGAEVGRVDAVLRPMADYGGVLLDMAEAQLFPENDGSSRGAHDPDRPELVATAIRELLLRWYETSRFAVAFADHEAEFDVEPDRLWPSGNPYSLLALPTDRADDRPTAGPDNVLAGPPPGGPSAGRAGAPGGAPLAFYCGGWPISPLGA